MNIETLQRMSGSAMKCLYGLRFMRRDGNKIEGSTRALSAVTGLARSSVMLARRELELAGVISIVDVARGMLVLQSNGSGPISDPLSKNAGLKSDPPKKSAGRSVTHSAPSQKAVTARKSSLDRLSLLRSSSNQSGIQVVGSNKKEEKTGAIEPSAVIEEKSIPTPIDKMKLHNTLHHSFKALGIPAKSDMIIWTNAEKQARHRLREGAKYDDLRLVAQWAASELRKKKWSRFRSLPYLWGAEYNSHLANAKDSGYDNTVAEQVALRQKEELARMKGLEL